MIAKQATLQSALLLILLTAINCRSAQTIASQQEKEIYIDQFKLTYFRQLLLKSYNNSEAIREVIRKDHSGFTEPVLSEEDYRLIDSPTFSDNEKLKADSARGHRRAEGAQGKRPLGFVMDKLGSSWLDSLANERYRRLGVGK